MPDRLVFLRRVLLLDAGVSGATGLLLMAAGAALEPWLGLPAALLRPAGASLLPFAAALIVLARAPEPPRAAVQAVIALNALWVAASLFLLVGRWVSPTPLGYAFVVVQAVAVLGFAELQWTGLRRMGGIQLPPTEKVRV